MNRIDPDNRPDDFWPWRNLNQPIEYAEPEPRSLWWFVIGGVLGVLLAAAQTC